MSLSVKSLPGIGDPCEKDAVDVCSNLTAQEREDMTSSAQANTRVILDCSLENSDTCLFVSNSIASIASNRLPPNFQSAGHVQTFVIRIAQLQ